jgi:hypothetical protein
MSLPNCPHYARVYLYVLTQRVKIIRLDLPNEVDMKDLSDHLLKYLNSDRDRKGLHRRLVTAANSLRFVTAGKVARGEEVPPPAPAREYRKAVIVFHSHLRELTDKWIASGIDGKFEYPSQRTLVPGTGAHRALLSWDRSNRAHTFRAPTGELRILAGRYESTQPIEPHDNPVKRRRNEAVWMFGELMNDLRLKRQIAKCGSCRKYYFRAKPRPRYPLKSACVPCGKRMPQDAKREKEHGVLIAKAALSLRQWKGLSEPERKSYLSIQDYIAGQVKRRGVGVTWVGKYWKEIQQYKPEKGVVG